MGGVPTQGLRWVGALVEAAKAAWYLFLRKAQFVEPVFSGTRPRWKVQRGHAHASHWPRQRLADDPRLAAEDPILRVLRRRAAVDLFEWLGLDQVPTSYWTLLDRVNDPSKALIELIANNRFDPALVRKRDAAELAAFRNFVRFVCQIEESIDLVSERQRALLDRHAHYGEHAIVRSLLELFVTLNEAVKVFERSPGSYRFAAFDSHARRVARLREKAGPTDLREAKALLDVSRQYARLMWRFTNAVDQKEQIEAAAGDRWMSLPRQDQAIWAGLLSDLARTQSVLMDDADRHVQKEVEYFEQCVEGLAALLDEAAKRERAAAAARRATEQRKRREEQARRREEARRQQEKGENKEQYQPDFGDREAHNLSRDELLAVFGFAPGVSLELGTLRRAFIREANKTHPVFGQADYRERNDRYRVLKDAYERLKIAFG